MNYCVRLLFVLLMMSVCGSWHADAEDDTPLPKLDLNSSGLRKKYDPRICPRCGKPYEECIKIGKCVKAAEIPVRPFPCPVCKFEVNIPLRDLRTEDIDEDLCPHPKGLVRFYSPIVMCPNCGFSAYRDDFRKPQTPETAAWIMEEIQPVTHKQLQELMAVKTKLDTAQLAGYFNQQENLPDIVRCTNAALYYKRINAPVPVQATVIWQLAWAHRRYLSSPLKGAGMMELVRKVNASLERAGIADMSIDERINLLSDLCRQPARFPFANRQMMLMMLSGYYSRAGLNSWAKLCLEEVITNSTKEYETLGKDPWLAGTEGTQEERLRSAKSWRAAFGYQALSRLKSLMEENRLLGVSSQLIYKGLEENLFSLKDRPAYIYLIGEFERRRENFSRALLWLSAAKSMPTSKNGIECYAPSQIEKMKTYVAALKVKPKTNDLDKTDRQLLGRLMKEIAEEAKTGNAASAVPGETP